MNVLPEMEPYMFDLPAERVAQRPAAVRGAERLMVLARGEAGQRIAPFGDLPLFLPAGALLVFNDARVTPARLLGRGEGGGRVEAFILAPPAAEGQAGEMDLWCLARPGRKFKVGAQFVFGGELAAEVREIDGEGRRLMRFHFTAPPLGTLERLGHVPLPAYIKRPDAEEDRDRYQTVYSRVPGAVAAPTAGLHFTRAMLARLGELGFPKAFVTLRVSAGTFAPLTASQLATGRLHREYITIPPETAAAVNQAKDEGRPVVAVGTTSVRSLEWAAMETGGALRPMAGWGDLFIRPGHQFKVVDGLVTNFHLPGSSLIMLVSALAGRERILAAYAAAIGNKMNFYSYGDAMLIL